jgi:hypothetical protein
MNITYKPISVSELDKQLEGGPIKVIEIEGLTRCIRGRGDYWDYKHRLAYVPFIMIKAYSEKELHDQEMSLIKPALKEPDFTSHSEVTVLVLQDTNNKDGMFYRAIGVYITALRV